MDTLQLQVDMRDGRGKGPARRLRAEGFVPAVLYGGGAESLALKVAESELAAIMRQGSNQIIDLKGPDGFKDRLVLLKEYQRHPITRALLHADFYTVDTTQQLDVSIPVHVIGKSVGVEMGGVMDLILRELQVRCLPLSIPESFEIDVSALDIGDALHVSDVALPDDVELVTDPGLTLVHVVAPRVEAEAEEEEGEGEEGAAEGDGAAPAEGAAPADAGEGSSD